MAVKPEDNISGSLIKEVKANTGVTMTMASDFQSDSAELRRHCR